MKSDFRFQKSIFKKGCLKNHADENGTFLVDSPFPQFQMGQKHVTDNSHCKYFTGSNITPN
jgi:hypothetical protein